MDQFLFILKSFLLGIVEGLTEFLPVSSTGHLIIFQNLIGFKSNTPNYIEMYTYVIQLGAILAVVVLYWNKIISTFKNFLPQNNNFKKSGLNFWLMIALACIPGVAGELILGDLADKYLFGTVPVAIALIFGAVLLILFENKYRNNKLKDKNFVISPKQAIIIGAFQCLAIFPGMSRSASTVMGGWVAGLSTVAAAEFSFFLAIPVMFGMSALKIIQIDGLSSLSSIEAISLAVGFLVSFIVAMIVVNKFINYLKHKPMKIFAYYRVIFAVIVLIAGAFGIFHNV